MKLKNITFKNVLIIFIIILSTQSCTDFFADDNSDPNKPKSVAISAALPAIELTIIDSKGGLYSNFSNMFIQQVEGVERQWESFNKYDILPVRTNAPWQQMYENVFVELRTVKQQALDGELNHYLGIAKTIEAYALMMTSDVFGDIPYTEAGLGDENSNPAYDDQATVIYPAIKTLLTEALVLFDGEPGPISPDSDDVLYGGDIGLWKLATHGILARYYLHLGDNTNALVEAKLSFTSRADNMGYKYPGDGLNDAGWFGFNDSRLGDIEFHPTMRAIMTGLNDNARLAVLDQTFNAEHPYLVADLREDLITYRELQFIIAETATDAGEKQAAYLRGIEASFTEFGLGTADYNAYAGQNAINPGAGNITMNHIMTQKYIGLFVQPEAFSDWRRTGIPNLTPVTGASVPRRWFYPENEYLFNSSAPARDDQLLFKKVDWDN